MPLILVDPSIPVYPLRFLLTGSTEDPRSLDYTKLTHLERRTSGPFADVVEKRWFMNYNETTTALSVMAVRCTYSYVRDSSNVITQSTEHTEWYMEDGSVGTTRTLVTFYR